MTLLKGLPPERAMMEMKILRSLAPAELSPQARQGLEQMMKMMPMPSMAGANEPVGVGARSGATAAPRPKRRWWEFWK